MAKTGRPRIEINKEQFEKLCALMCTLDDISGFFNVSPDTIERWTKREYKTTFADTYKKLSGKGKISLRKMQFDSARRGSVPMQIFLGKQYLNQSDNPACDDVRRQKLEFEIIRETEKFATPEVLDDGFLKALDVTAANIDWGEQQIIEGGGESNEQD